MIQGNDNRTQVFRSHRFAWRAVSARRADGARIEYARSFRRWNLWRRGLGHLRTLPAGCHFSARIGSQRARRVLAGFRDAADCAGAPRAAKPRQQRVVAGFGSTHRRSALAFRRALSQPPRARRGFACPARVSVFLPRAVLRLAASVRCAAGFKRACPRAKNQRGFASCVAGGFSGVEYSAHCISRLRKQRAFARDALPEKTPHAIAHRRSTHHGAYDYRNAGFLAHGVWRGEYFHQYFSRSSTTDHFRGLARARRLLFSGPRFVATRSLTTFMSQSVLALWLVTVIPK